jgi:hypothetical protein
MNTVRAFQIFYSEATRAQLDPDFEPLDNLANERPDWHEYWPMRRWFAANAMDESVLYGFFSPRFFGKTQLKARQVLEFARAAGDADVVTFSPHPCHSTCFFNVFEQGANFHPGFLEVATAFLQDIAPHFRLDGLCNDSRNTVFCNYFVARPSFWREWQRIFARMFELCETPGTSLHALLTRPVRYGKDFGDNHPAFMKVMVMERVPSLILSSRAFRVRNYAPLAMPLNPNFYGRLPELVALDALKIAYAETGDAQFLRQFVDRRDRLLAAVFPKGMS